MLTVTIENVDTLERQLRLTEREVAKATARGINRATALGRLAAQAALPGTFPTARPNPLRWMRTAVRFERKDAATPDRLEARITVGAPSYQLGRRWMILNIFEAGGTQKAKDNVPTLGFRAPVLAKGVARRDAPRLKDLGLAFRKDVDQNFYLARGRGSLGGAARGNKPRKGVGRVYGQRRTFLLRTKKGIPAVMQRTGKGKDDVRALWWLRRSQPVPRRPWFERASSAAANEALPRLVDEEMRKQLAYAFERRGLFG